MNRPNLASSHHDMSLRSSFNLGAFTPSRLLNTRLLFCCDFNSSPAISSAATTTSAVSNAATHRPERAFDIIDFIKGFSLKEKTGSADVHRKIRCAKLYKLLAH